jgi:tRNA A37 threonylcarbamoyltransferase TsaD
LEAGVWSAGGPESDVFLMLHASGGTTDLLLARKNAEGRYDLENVGGSIDLHAGQFIDRVGVALKLQFPCGNALEELAKTSTAPIPSTGVCTGYKNKLWQVRQRRLYVLCKKEWQLQLIWLLVCN